jgi:hypothetical protein
LHISALKGGQEKMSVVRQLVENYTKKVFPVLGLTGEDRLVVVFDAGIDSVCQVALRSAVGILQSEGAITQILEASIPTGPAQDLGMYIEGQMRDATAFLYHTSMSRSHCPQTRMFIPGKDENGELIKRADGRPQARLLSITNGKADTLLKGAVNEDLVAMRERIVRINKMTEGVTQFHITTQAGTNLWVTPWPEMMVVDNGLITQPGQLGNYPFGEGCSCAVKFSGTNGLLVSDGVIGAGIGQVDKPITMHIEYGKICEILGGKSRDTLIRSMDDADRKMPASSLLSQPSRYIAEIAFGMNAAAWRVDESGKKVLPPTSLEAEKAYDPDNTSIHIAHGANHIFGVPAGHPYFNPVQHHTDHVLCGGVTVDAYFHEDRPALRLIDNGKPIY